jgi:hypothetical protein
MPGELQAVYYRAGDGSQPVDAFIDGLPVTHQAMIDFQLERLNKPTPTDPERPLPSSSEIDGDLRVLHYRHGSVQYAILYRRSRTLIVLLHIVRTDGGQVPEAEIEIARERQEDFRLRMRASRIAPGQSQPAPIELGPIGDPAPGRTRGARTV